MDKVADKVEENTIIIDDRAFKLNYLDPDKVRFFRAGDALRMTIDGDRSCLRVVPMLAFPMSLGDQYISIRDMKENELGIIKNLNKLDKDSRKLLQDEIQKRYFTPVIKQVKSIREKMGVVEWEVETDRGAKKFLTRRIHHSLEETQNGFIIKDVENNRYEVRNYSDLDARSLSIVSKNI